MKPRNFTQRFEFWMTEKQNRQLEELALYYHQSKGAVLRDAIGPLYVMMAMRKLAEDREVNQSVEDREVNHIS